MRKANVRPCVLAAGLVVLVTGCETLALTNPWDPRVPVTLSITGPDQAVLDDTVKYTVRADPDIPGAVPIWKVDAPGNFVTFGDGRFRVQGAPPYTITVTALVGPDTARKLVSVVAKPKAP